MSHTLGPGAGLPGQLYVTNECNKFVCVTTSNNAPLSQITRHTVSREMPIPVMWEEAA